MDAPAAELEALIEGLARVDSAALGDLEGIRVIGLLERGKAAMAAAQARVTAAFDAAQREAATSRAEDVVLRRSVGCQVALARQDSPVAGSRHVGVARALVEEMPCTLAALTAGETSEWRATIMVRESALLSREHRVALDAELGPQLGGMGNRRVEKEARRIAYRLDPTSLLRRTRGAESDRRVSVRPAPDTMSNLTAFLPVAQGVAVFTALRAHAASLRGLGDGRTLGQLMADTLVERCTGRATATGVPVEVQLVATDACVFGTSDEPGHVPGYGPVPAETVRRLTREADRAWVCRLFADPKTGTLVAMDSKRRRFEGQLRHLVVLRDDVCRTPWCDAPIKHVDHPRRAADGGPTSTANSQGLCEACNYAKEAPGWSARAVGETVVTTTPIGRRHISRPPPLLGVSTGPSPSRLDLWFERVIALAS